MFLIFGLKHKRRFHHWEKPLNKKKKKKVQNDLPLTSNLSRSKRIFLSEITLTPQWTLNFVQPYGTYRFSLVLILYKKIWSLALVSFTEKRPHVISKLFCLGLCVGTV